MRSTGFVINIDSWINRDNSYYLVIIEKTSLYHTVIGDRALFHTSKTAKMIKVILLRAPCQNVNVLGPKHIGFTILTCQDHMTPSVTWPFDSQVAISYRHSIVTRSLSPAVSEIMDTKYVGVTTLTFQSHVTSPFDSQVAISYRCSSSSSSSSWFSVHLQ